MLWKYVTVSLWPMLSNIALIHNDMEDEVAAGGHVEVLREGRWVWLVRHGGVSDRYRWREHRSP